MEQCIVCRALKPAEKFNREHVFPEALGGTLVTRRVCTACNSWLGQKADGPLVNSPIMQLARMAYQISGKSGVPNAFAGDARLADDPAQKVQIRTDLDGNVVGVHHVPRHEKTVNEDGTTRFRLTVDGSARAKLPTMVNKTLERAGAPPLSPEEVWAKARVIRHDPLINQTITYDLQSPRLGMLKIVYELAHYWLGDAYLHDPMSKALASALLAKDDNWAAQFGIKGTIGFKQDQSPLRLWADETASHIALLSRSGTTLMVMATVFHVFDAMIVVSETAAHYEPVEERFLAINVLTRESREAPFMDEIFRKTPPDTWNDAE